MSRFSADTRLRSAQAHSLFALNEPALRLKQAIAVLYGALLTPLVLAAEQPDEHTRHTNEPSPTVITAIAPSSPLTIVTNPKDPRQPVPASSGVDNLFGKPSMNRGARSGARWI